MKDNKIDINSLVTIETMPKIFEQLDKIGEFIKESLDGVNELTCTEENKQLVKNKRTEINNTLKMLEDRRKDIKKQILSPYDLFNEKYENVIKGQLVNASETLSNKIDAIEREQKQLKEDELRVFASEHFIANNIQDIVTFENIGLNITLSASIKSLKEEIVDFCKKIADDLDTILLEEKHNEILVEYKKCLDYAQAKKIVLEREKAIKEIDEKSQNIINNKEQQFEISTKIDELTQDEMIITAPKEITKEIDPNELILVSFSVTGTQEQLKQLKEFMTNIGIEWR